MRISDWSSDVCSSYLRTTVEIPFDAKVVLPRVERLQIEVAAVAEPPGQRPELRAVEHERIGIEGQRPRASEIAIAGPRDHLRHRAANQQVLHRLPTDVEAGQNVGVALRFAVRRSEEHTSELQS